MLLRSSLGKNVFGVYNFIGIVLSLVTYTIISFKIIFLIISSESESLMQNYYWKSAFLHSSTILADFADAYKLLLLSGHLSTTLLRCNRWRCVLFLASYTILYLTFLCLTNLITEASLLLCFIPLCYTRLQVEKEFRSYLRKVEPRKQEDKCSTACLSSCL